jgi:hypothetical protein
MDSYADGNPIRLVLLVRLGLFGFRIVTGGLKSLVLILVVGLDRFAILAGGRCPAVPAKGKSSNQAVSFQRVTLQVAICEVIPSFPEVSCGIVTASPGCERRHRMRKSSVSGCGDGNTPQVGRVQSGKEQ